MSRRLPIIHGVTERSGGPLERNIEELPLAGSRSADVREENALHRVERR